MFARCRIVCLIVAVLLSANVGRGEDAERQMEVSVEVKFVEITESVFAELKEQGFVNAQAKDSHAREPVTFLNDARALRFLETVQKDIQSHVMQAPKLTTLNGQKTRINVVDDQSFEIHWTYFSREGEFDCVTQTEVVPLGVRIALRPVISADRRSIRLRMDLKWDDLVSGTVRRTLNAATAEPSAEESPETLTHAIQQPRINHLRMDRTLNIRDGNTAVVTGLMRQCEVSKSVGPEILSEIPYLGQLFRKIEHETHHLLVLVTPHILVTPEKDEKLPRTVRTKETKVCSSGGDADRTSPPPWVTERMEEKYCYKNDFRTPILPPIREGFPPPLCEPPPDEARILRAMPKVPRGVPYFYKEGRDNIQIVTERILDKIDPPRFFPLIGPAQLHHCHWKCTVYYTETIESAYPFPFRCVRPRVEVVFIELDRLHLYTGGDVSGR